ELRGEGAELLLAHPARVLGAQGAALVERGLGLARLRLRLLPVRLRPLERQAVALDVDPREDGIRPDGAPFVEADLVDDTRDARRNAHDLLREERPHGLDRVADPARRDELDTDRDLSRGGGG